MAKRIIAKVELRWTEPNGYEFAVGAHDYHIRLEDGVWILDQFDSGIQDANEAHVESLEVESLADGVHYALEEAEA